MKRLVVDGYNMYNKKGIPQGSFGDKEKADKYVTRYGWTAKPWGHYEYDTKEEEDADFNRIMTNFFEDRNNRDNNWNKNTNRA